MTEDAGRIVPAATGSGGWLTRNLKVVSGVSFLQDAASELLYPILPIFLTVTLGAPAAVVGVVEGLAEGAASVTKVAAGWLSDRYRRRPLIGLGYGLAAVGKVLVAVAGAWPMVLAGRCVDRLGKGVRGAPRDALIAADVPAAARGRAFGFHRSMDTAGAVVGPLIGLAAFELLHQRIRPLLWIAVVPAVASVALVAALRDPARATPVGERLGWNPRRLPGRFWRTVAVLVLFSLVNFPDALLLLRLHDIGFTVPAVIGAYVTYNVVYTLLSYPAGALADRMTPALVFAVGLTVFAVAYTGLGLTRSHTAAWLLIAGYGGFTALTDGVGKAWISGLLPATAQGSGQGVFQGLSGLGVLAAGVWAGLAWGADGRLPLLVSGLTAAVLAAGLLSAATANRRTA
ncbi:MFS transporter [Dactylosporangium sp. CA-233914]|uniref:MFS transporter n=1 Tax=Dactylosporangium sp. CA-233914 TaxID=3239934 RepID=UPI003D8C0AB6